MGKNIDLVKGRYVASSINTVWCVDATFIYSGSVLAVIDLASRLVLGHAYMHGITSNEFTSGHLKEFFTFLLKRMDRPGSIIIHSDRGGQFISEDYSNFCEENQIHRSVQEGRFNNQVIERWNKKFKELLLFQLHAVKQKPSGFLTLEYLKELPKEEVQHLVTKAVQLSNEEPNAANFKMSPNIAEVAFTRTPPRADLPLLAKKGEPAADEIEDYKAYSAESFIWDYFKSWRAEVSEGFNTLIKQNNQLLHEKEEQTLLLKEQSEKINALVAARKKEQEEREKQEFARKKRKEAKRMPPRDCLSADLFFTSLEQHAYKSPLIRARVRVAMTLLYLTGLRISNLLCLTVGQYQNFLNKKPVAILLIKRGGTKTIELPSFSTRFVNAIAGDTDLLCKDKALEDPLFHSKLGSNALISRSKFTDQLNKTLREVSQACGLNLKSHSFRISFVTDLLRQSVPLYKVSELVGHKLLQTTMRYNRGGGEVLEGDGRQIISTLTLHRVKKGMKTLEKSSQTRIKNRSAIAKLKRKKS